MTTRGSQTITWDVENRPTAIDTATFVYDGDGKRVKKTENGQTTVYVNKYYEKNVTTGEATLHYYFGDRHIALSRPDGIRYVHLDHLAGSSVFTDVMSGLQTGSIKYYPFGATRSTSGAIPTDKKFTGQRLDSTGLYYYNARYYDPSIGRFISPDTFVPWSAGFGVVSGRLTVSLVPQGLGTALAPGGPYPASVLQSPVNPQALNRYSYVLNDPLRYTDPYGWWTFGFGNNVNIGTGRGWSGSWMVVIDGHGNVAIAKTKGSGNFYGAAASVSGQIQVTNADSVKQLAGNSIAIGGSATVGPTTPASLTAVNFGPSGGGESVIGDDYQGLNLNLGWGISIMPFETHGFEEETNLMGQARLPLARGPGLSGTADQPASQAGDTSLAVSPVTQGVAPPAVSIQDPGDDPWYGYYD